MFHTPHKLKTQKRREQRDDRGGYESRWPCHLRGARMLCVSSYRFIHNGIQDTPLSVHPVKYFLSIVVLLSQPGSV